MTGYARENFGQAWSDDVRVDGGRNGCDTRNDILRRDFANDPRNLQATDADLNRQKGAGDAATWQPPNKDHRCAYARQQIEVKAAYGLWITPAGHTALARELDRCH